MTDDAGWRFWAETPPDSGNMVIEIRRGRKSLPFRTTANRLGPYFNIASIEWRPATHPRGVDLEAMIRNHES